MGYRMLAIVIWNMSLPAGVVVSMCCSLQTGVDARPDHRPLELGEGPRLRPWGLQAALKR
jgi:hypothetical protein